MADRNATVGGRYYGAPLLGVVGVVAYGARQLALAVL